MSLRSALLSTGFVLCAICVLPVSVRAQQGLTLEEAIRTAFSKSPELKEAESEEKIRRLQSTLSASPFLPKLFLEAGRVNEESENSSNSGPFAYAKASWNLFNGGQDFAVRQIRLREQMSAKIKLELLRTGIERTVTKNFVDLLYLDEVLKLREEELARNRDLLQIAKRKAAGGLTSSADLLEFEFRESALRSEMQLLRHERSVASRSLSASMGIDTEQEDLKVSGDLRISGVLSSKMGENLNARINGDSYLSDLVLTDVKLGSETAAIQKLASFSTWLPSLNLEAHYGDLRYGDPTLPENPAWRIELKLSMPIFTGLETIHSRTLANENFRASEARLRKAELEAKNLLADRNEKLKVLESLMELQKENLIRAERYLKASVDEYRRGIRNSADVTEANGRFFDARKRQLALTRDFVVTKLALLDQTLLELP